MPTVQVSAQLDVKHLIAAVKQLSPTEWREFSQAFDALRKKNGIRISKEARLLVCVQENTRLPDPQQRRYEQLRRKCERQTLTEGELEEYQSLVQQLESRNAKRLEALISLAKRRGIPVPVLMADLGLQTADDVE